MARSRRPHAELRGASGWRGAIVLTGPSQAGKSTLASSLAFELGAAALSARDVLRSLSKRSLDTRVELQAFGARIEEETRGFWLADGIRKVLDEERGVIVDSARTASQTQAITVSTMPALFIHLTASEVERKRRFCRTADSNDFDRGLTFTQFARHPIEAGADALRSAADLVLDTTASPPDQILQAAVEFIRNAAPQG